LNCDFRFTTYERVETLPITVLKRNGNKETFNKSKILNGLTKACEKISIGSNKLELIVDELELELQQRNTREVNSEDIGEMVLAQLRGINEVAYIRFASVYKQFHGINDFIATLDSFKSEKGKFATVI
tara:strand:+ start:183 stop:566 length:384 start_codon:yes stop_codon:yes gene_type:complete